MAAADLQGRPSVLVVDDEPSYQEALLIALSAEGFAVSAVGTAAEARSAIKVQAPDLMLLDINLPDMSGIEFCREVLAERQLHIIMVSARNDEVDIVLGLELGAGDYVAKPFRTRELVARMNALLRRSHQAQVDGLKRVTAGPVTVDYESRTVLVRGKEVQFTRKEFELLSVLLESLGQVVSREALIDQVWWGQDLTDTRTLDTHLKRLRKKIEKDAGDPKHLITVRGIGFRFDI